MSPDQPVHAVHTVALTSLRLSCQHGPGGVTNLRHQLLACSSDLGIPLLKPLPDILSINQRDVRLRSLRHITAQRDIQRLNKGAERSDHHQDGRSK